LSFNIADQYRTPVLIMADEVVGHMVERVVIPPEEQIEYWERKKPKSAPNGKFDPFQAEDPDLVPPMVHAGEGYRIHYTGLTHDERGYPDVSPKAHHRLVTRLVNKIELNADRIVRLESYQVEDAEVIVIAYGCTARSARRAVREARESDIPAGMVRLISLWPFPGRLVAECIQEAASVIVAEMNLGQMIHEVERCIMRPVKGVHHAGGEMIPPGVIRKAIREAVQ